MQPDKMAVIAIVKADDATLKPALFVYETPDGFAWVDPAYLDGVACNELVHRVKCTIRKRDNSFTAEGCDGRTYFVSSIYNLSTIDLDKIRVSFDWALKLIDKTGRTIDQERESIRQMLGDSFV